MESRHSCTKPMQSCSPAFSTETSVENLSTEADLAVLRCMTKCIASAILRRLQKALASQTEWLWLLLCQHSRQTQSHQATFRAFSSLFQSKQPFWPKLTLKSLLTEADLVRAVLKCLIKCTASALWRILQKALGASQTEWLLQLLWQN